jgi:hypothetical protein
MDANFSLFSGSLVTTCSILGILGTVLRAMVTVSLPTVTGIPYISCLGSVRRGLSNSGSYSSSNLTSFRFLLFEGRRYANLATSRVAHKIDLLIDVTLRPDFTGAGSATLTTRITYRKHRNRQVAFLPACMSTSGRIHGELPLRLLVTRHRRSFAIASASCSTATGAASGCHVLRHPIPLAAATASHTPAAGSAHKLCIRKKHEYRSHRCDHTISKKWTFVHTENFFDHTTKI